MKQVRLLAFSGSTREASFNQKLVTIAAQGASEAGAEVTVISLRDFPMPLYDGDLEARSGIPEQGKRFKQLLKDHDGFIISSPEYNSSLSAVLKNAIDWASRTEGKEPGLVAFAGKTAAIVAASPGALGGLRGLVHLRAILSNINVLVIPDQLALKEASAAFAPDGSIVDAKMQARAKEIGAKLAKITQKLN